MWCRRVRSQLSAYMDGELSMTEARNLEQHLAHCEGCSYERDSLDRLTRITSLIPEEEVPADLHSRIMTRLAYAEASPVATVPSRRMAPFGPLVWTAVAGATATVAFAYVQSCGPKGPVRPSAVPPAVAQRAPVGEGLAAREAEAGSHRIARHESFGSGRAADAARPQPEAECDGPVSRPMTVDMRGAKLPTRATQKPDRLERPIAPSVLPLEDRPQPLVVNTPAGNPVMEARASLPEVPVTPETPEIVAMPGDPVVNSTGTMQPLVGAEPVVAMEKDPGMRMAGPGPTEEQIPADDEEGLRALRLFFEERNRVVPQPPALDLIRPRRGRKSL